MEGGAIIIHCISFSSDEEHLKRAGLMGRHSRMVGWEVNVVKKTILSRHSAELIQSLSESQRLFLQKEESNFSEVKVIEKDPQ